MTAQPEVKRCPTLNPDGEACRVPEGLLIESEEQPGVFFCFNHLPDAGMDEARELARSKGGRRSIKQRPRYLDAQELGALETPVDAKRWASVIALAVATGRLSSHAASVVKALLGEFLASHAAIDVEERFEALEAQIKAMGQ